MFCEPARHRRIAPASEASSRRRYNLVVLTEREKFLVPLFARGGTPLLDLPDVVNFSTCPVKSAERATGSRRSR